MFDAQEIGRDDEEQIHPFDRLYCQLCEQEGHTQRSCPTRDDNYDAEMDDLVRDHLDDLEGF